MSNNDMTIPAHLVASGVGLPPVWRMDMAGGPFVGPGHRESILEMSGRDVLDRSVFAGDPQTAFGLAMRLDQWEHETGDERSWTLLLGRHWATRLWSPLLLDMLARIEHIGMDHEIRRKLWPNVEGEPGTLGVLERVSGDWWRLTSPQACGPEMSAEWELPDIADLAEALRAIWAEVCS